MALIDHRDAAEAGLRVLTDPALWGAHHDLTGPVPLSWPEALELLSAELLAAKLIGRWRSGAPLTLAPARDDPELETYIDLPLGIVDAAVIAIAERLQLTEIATLDQRHFNVVRPVHVQSFTLLPGATTF